MRDPRVTSRKLKVSLAVATVDVNESIIRRTLNINGVHGRAVRRNPLLSKQNIGTVCGSLKTTWSQKVIRTMFCEWMRPKSNFLA